MQEYGFIQNLGMTAEKFWNENSDFAKKHDMDQILSYMYLMVKKASSPDYDITKKQLNDHGKKIELFEGVKHWFNLIRTIGDNLKIKIEHYIISAGIKEMIEGCSIRKEFTKIYASSFAYKNDNTTPIWPSKVINATNKTQFLFRINKGCLEDNDDEGLNKSIPQSNRRIPFNHIIYIGDSITDIPCMTLVKRNGGYSIGVYNPEDKSKGKAYDLIRDDRVNYYAPADYSKDKELYLIINHILHKIQTEIDLDQISNTQKKEQKVFEFNMRRNYLIFSLIVEE
jgi:2-hydroxy-3-keto-5-methylthiopentenyl-1-phosphate phosphatase